jgi:hypothetical protein
MRNVLSLLKQGAVPKGTYSALFPDGHYERLTDSEGKEMYRKFQERNIVKNEINECLLELGIKKASSFEAAICKIAKAAKRIVPSIWEEKHGLGGMGYVICKHGAATQVLELDDDILMMIKYEALSKGEES